MPSLNPASEHLLSSYTTGSDQFSSVAQSCPILFVPMDCPSPTLGACSNSSPSTQWCHPTISSSVIPFCSCFQSFPASRKVSQLFTSGGQSIGASTSAISPFNEYSGLVSFRVDWFDLTVHGILKSLSNTTVWKHQFFSAQPSLWSSSHIHTWLLEKP